MELSQIQVLPVEPASRTGLIVRPRIHTFWKPNGLKMKTEVPAVNDSRWATENIGFTTDTPKYRKIQSKPQTCSNTDFDNIQRRNIPALAA